MSVFPEGFDPRADVVGVLDLISIDTPDGLARFMPGIDGIFTDVDGHQWVGSTLITPGDMELARGGAAPSGSIGMSFFQDPAAADLVTELRALGAAYVAGREIVFWAQPLLTLNDFYAPTVPPFRVATRLATSPTFGGEGAYQRSIMLAFETGFAGRGEARGWQYTTEDHARLTGSANPSLTYMPTDLAYDEKIFG